jgi:hypothetical protein
MTPQFDPKIMAVRKLGAAMKKTLQAGTVLVALLLTPLGAGAGNHQICYQKPPARSSRSITARFACRTDGSTAPGCTVTGVQSASSFTRVGSPSTTSDEAEATFAGPGTYTGSFHFSDGTNRTCTLEIPPVAAFSSGQGSQDDLVTAFTTDVSGLVTTGVWKATSLPGDYAGQQVVVPPDFVAVGGGAEGAEWPNGFLLLTSRHWEGNISPSNPQQSWIVEAQSNVPPQASPVTGYAIGLKIEGISYAALKAMVKFPEAFSWPDVPHPTVMSPVDVTYPQTRAAIGGGVLAHIFADQFVTATLPQTLQQCYANNTCEQLVSGWIAASYGRAILKKDHINPRPGRVMAEITTLPKELTIAGTMYHVETWEIDANSPVAAHPSATVQLPLDFALTGVGAFVNWETSPTAAGNLLWSLKPLQGGAAAASKDQMISSPASLTVYAIGMKLVLGPVPPRPPFRPAPKIPQPPPNPN